jgi:hypothetical protein
MPTQDPRGSKIPLSERPVLASSAPGRHAVRHDDVARWTLRSIELGTDPGEGSPFRTRFLSTMTNSSRTHRSRNAPQSRFRMNHHARSGGARRDRTDDLMLAKHALSQLSYGPALCLASGAGGRIRGLGWRAIRRGARSRLRPCGPRRQPRRKAIGPKARKAERPPRPSARSLPQHGGPGTTRTSDLTLIRGAL